MCAVVFGLFALRYLVTSSLSLQQSLIPIHLGSVFERLEKSLSAENHQLPDPDSLDRQQASAPKNADSQQNDGQNAPLGSEELKSGKPDGTNSSEAAAQKADAQDSKSSQDGKPNNRDGSPSAAQPTPGDENGQQSGNQNNSQQAPNTKEQKGEGQQGSSGLMDKMKDALSSLMAKMRPTTSAQKSLQNSERSNEDQKGGGQTAGSKDQQGQQQQNAGNEQPSKEQSSEGQAQGQTTEKSQASQGHSSEQAPDKKGADAHSGIGRQDGDKDVKEAEQLQAMGKLAEIIGKRSANLTGEMMVETPSGKQQLKTEYSQHMGHHSDLGGEINRDEIPLMYQQYVREYMEQVRKQQGKTGQ